ncbi:hypothetical protein H0H93_002145 [Arthromyces matolae]|nr:hypothetical protein H0H93_002145 [Arthromyces matolae]
MKTFGLPSLAILVFAAALTTGTFGAPTKREPTICLLCVAFLQRSSLITATEAPECGKPVDYWLESSSTLNNVHVENLPEPWASHRPNLGPDISLADTPYRQLDEDGKRLFDRAMPHLEKEAQHHEELMKFTRTAHTLLWLETLQWGSWNEYGNHRRPPSQAMEYLRGHLETMNSEEKEEVEKLLKFYDALERCLKMAGNDGQGATRI